jgi:hypothetical protein
MRQFGLSLRIVEAFLCGNVSISRNLETHWCEAFYLVPRNLKALHRDKHVM